MWPPPDIRSLPSKEEIYRVKKEISTIELEIIETELRLNALRNSLLERKAWIAPIRKTPHELLSLIFIEASRSDWKAPLVLQSVSRQWRNVVVDSPEVWTFIPLSKYSSRGQSELISLFLERSRNTPLHISVENDNLLGYMELLADRIECIRLGTNRFLVNRYLQHDHAFHRLERLEILDIDLFDPATDTDSPAAWDMLLFPNLKVLNIQCRSPSLLRAICAAPEPPAIRHLKVNTMYTWGLHDILTKYATSLESVDLIYGNSGSEELDMGDKIHFPCLRYMRLVDRSGGRGSVFCFEAATPNLLAHLDDGIKSTSNAVEVDTDSVILLHALRTPDFFRYPRLVTLGFGPQDTWGEEVMKAIECLRDNPALCPNLALIEYVSRRLTQGQIVKAKDALLARERVNGQNIQMLRKTIQEWEERAQNFRVVEPCGYHMPCRL